MKQIIKRLGLLLLLLTAILTAHAGVKFSYNGLNFCTYDTGDSCYVADNRGANGAIVIPDAAFYNGMPYTVTSIGEYAFSGCSGITSLTISYSVTSIDKYAFSDCSGITSLKIHNSVTSIGESAFSGCSGLTSVTISKFITEISAYTFSGCSGLTSVTIPNSVTSIGE